jgi:hypothetical protein
MQNVELRAKHEDRKDLPTAPVPRRESDSIKPVILSEVEGPLNIPPPATATEPNPLLRLPQDDREEIFIWLREGSDYDAINIKLLDKGLPTATPREIDHFFRTYAHDRWTRRIDRAAEEANALIASVRRSPGNMPEAVLVALGQEAFRQISSGKAEAQALARYTALFLRARDQDRAERALAVQTEKIRHTQRTSVEKALDAFAHDLPQNPAALKAFQQLKQQLLEPEDPATSEDLT